MDKHYYSGKNLEEAIEAAITDLREQKENLIIREKEVKSGLFSKKIEIEVIEKREVESYIKSLIQQITTNIGIQTNIEVKHRDGSIIYDLYGDNNGILIGRNGRTIDALTTVIRQAVRNEIGENFLFSIDVSDYKKHMDRDLVMLAKREAKKVVASKVEVRLTAMNSYQRRIVHNALTEFKGVYTESIGEEPERAVVIKPRED